MDDPSPACWADLLDDRFRDDMQLANPTSSGTACTLLATFLQLFGADEAFAFPADLHRNIARYIQSGGAPLRAAATGETAVGIVSMHDAVAQTVQGAPIVTVAPCEGTGHEVGSMSITAGGPTRRMRASGTTGPSPPRRRKSAPRSTASRCPPTSAQPPRPRRRISMPST